MVDQEILKRIERGRQIGFDDTKIKKLLLSKAHNPKKVEEAFAHSYKKSKKELKKIKATAKEGPFLVVFSIAFIIFIIFLIYFRNLITQRLQTSPYSIIFYILMGLLFLDIILIGIHIVKKSIEKRKIIRELGIEPVKKPLEKATKKPAFFTTVTSFFKKSKKETKEKTIKKEGTKKTEKIKEEKSTEKKEGHRLLQFFSTMFFISLIVIAIASFYKSWITFFLALILMFLSLLVYTLKKPRDIPEVKLRKQLEKQEEGVAKEVEHLLHKEQILKTKEDTLKHQIEEMVRKTTILEEKEESLQKKGIIIPTAHKEIFSKIKPDTGKSEPVITPASRSKKYETDFDMLVNVINQRGKLKLSEAAQIFKVTLKHVEEWGRILEEHGLIKVHYPAFGEAELIAKNEKNHRKV